MINGLIGQKKIQSQKFLEDGRRIPVTEIAVSDNAVLQIKTNEKDSYTAVQLGYGTKKKPFKSLAGHAKKLGVTTAPAVMRELRVMEVNDDLPKSGDLVTVDSVFKPGDIVDVTGTSKGKGFAGGVRRYNFRGGPKTHGQSDRHRAPGSIGQGTTPGRVYKGKRMAGHMGVDTVTIKNLTVVDVDAEGKNLYVLGLVPGHRDTVLFITKIGEQKNYVPLLKNEEAQETQPTEEVSQPVSEETETKEAVVEEVKTEEPKEDK